MGPPYRGAHISLHEALDQSGALLGPLLVAGMVALSGFRLGFAVLIVPGILAMGTLAWLHRSVPHPAAFEGSALPQRTNLQPHFSKIYWIYAVFSAVAMLGFATFGVLSYHLEVQHVLPAPLIPITYALAMGAAALAALVSGHAYDRFGLRVLAAVPLLTATVPFLSFTTQPALVWTGAVLWGVASGVHDHARSSRPPRSQATSGAGFGTFTAVYGLAWPAGATILGALYAASLPGLRLYVILSQALALLIFVVLLRTRTESHPGSASL